MAAKHANSPREINIKSAISELENGLHANIKDAARAHGIPYTTLYFRVKGRKSKDSNNNIVHHHNQLQLQLQDDMLTSREESLLSQYVKVLSRSGYPITSRHIYELIKEMFNNRSGKESLPIKSPSLSLTPSNDSYLSTQLSNSSSSEYNLNQPFAYLNSNQQQQQQQHHHHHHRNNSQIYSNDFNTNFSNGSVLGTNGFPILQTNDFYQQNNVNLNFSEPYLTYFNNNNNNNSNNNNNDYRVLDINGNGQIMNNSSSKYINRPSSTLPDYRTCKVWIERFIKRHPELPSIVCQPIDKHRSSTYLETTLKRWFKTYEKIIIKYGITSENVYNVDETGFILGETQRRWSIVDSSMKINHSREDNISVLECICGDNSSLDPYIIFKGKYIDKSWFPVETDENWQFICTENGWTNSHIIYDWLVNSFDKKTRYKCTTSTSGSNKNLKPRLLIYNGHPTHITCKFLNFCLNSNIQLLIIPPSTSHILQPLDLSIYGPLKYKMVYEMDLILSLGLSKVKKPEFILCLNKARKFSLIKENINNGFRKSGLIPFSPFY